MIDGRVPTVMGVGNLLMGDEGVGVHAVRRLRVRLPSGVRVIEAGLLGIEALADVETASRLLVLDCVDAGLAPGSLVRLDGSSLRAQAGPRLSQHEFGLPDLLALAELRSQAPEQVVVLGVQPRRIVPSLSLSRCVAGALPELLDAAATVVDGWAGRVTSVTEAPRGILYDRIPCATDPIAHGIGGR
jgi:hydrogenase maturation protease